MGNCHNFKKKQMENRSAQTDIQSFCKSNRDLNSSKYANYRPVSVHSKMNNNPNKHIIDSSIQLKNSILTDWKHPNRAELNFQKMDINNHSDSYNQNGQQFSDTINSSLPIQETFNPNSNGVWPINGSGDNYTENPSKKRRKNHLMKTTVTNTKIPGKNDVNLSDEEFNNHLLAEFECYDSDGPVKDEVKQGKTPIVKSNGCKPVKERVFANQNSICQNNVTKSKKQSNFKLKSYNHNSNNFNQLLENEVKANGHVMNTQKFLSSSLLDQDCYPIQYTFYVDDNDSCTKPFYDRRMVAIAKTCRCRIYFHAKSDENEKPLYYKGKPVRPVTITAPDMACLKRCLGSIDSQFPYFNCKAFLSLSN